MKRLVLVMAIVALMAVPAVADINRTPVLNGNVQSFNLGSMVTTGDPRANPVYSFTNNNGYYHGFLSPDSWDGELCETIMPGAWTMDGFSIGWAAPTGAPQTTMYIDFWSWDGYAPWSGNHIVGYSLPVTADGYAHIGNYTVSPVAMPTSWVWMTYSFNVAGAAAPNMGPLHVGVASPDPGAQVGTDYFEDGWYEWDGAAYHWWWYGGNPSSDLYAAMTPEPGALVLLAVGALALLRRR